jgi:hypothetical protein
VRQRSNVLDERGEFKETVAAQPPATLSQAGGTPPEGAETTWELASELLRSLSRVLNNRQERPAPYQQLLEVVEGGEIVRVL